MQYVDDTYETITVAKNKFVCVFNHPGNQADTRLIQGTSCPITVKAEETTYSRGYSCCRGIVVPMGRGCSRDIPRPIRFSWHLMCFPWYPTVSRRLATVSHGVYGFTVTHRLPMVSHRLGFQPKCTNRCFIFSIHRPLVVCVRRCHRVLAALGRTTDQDCSSERASERTVGRKAERSTNNGEP